MYSWFHIPPSLLSRHLDASSSAAAVGAAGTSSSSLDDGYLSDKSSPQSSAYSCTTDTDTLPDMERMMAVEEDEEEDSDQEDDEAMDQEDTTTTTVPSTPTGLIPTIDQLFKRSFSQELAELANSSSNSNHHQLCEDMLRASPADQQLVMLEDIQQILRDEANFQLCV